MVKRKAAKRTPSGRGLYGRANSRKPRPDPPIGPAKIDGVKRVPKTQQKKAAKEWLEKTRKKIARTKVKPLDPLSAYETVPLKIPVNSMQELEALSKQVNLNKLKRPTDRWAFAFRGHPEKVVTYDEIEGMFAAISSYKKHTGGSEEILLDKISFLRTRGDKAYKAALKKASDDRFHKHDFNRKIAKAKALRETDRYEAARLKRQAERELHAVRKKQRERIKKERDRAAKKRKR